MVQMFIQTGLIFLMTQSKTTLLLW